MSRQNRMLILLAITIPVVFAGCFGNSTSIVQKLFPNPPDTSNLVTFTSSLSPEERAWIVAEETFLRNGEIRKKGIVPIPHNGDDFRGHTLDDVYWRGVHVTEGDFRGDFLRTSDCSRGDFSYSDFRVTDMKWANFDQSILVKCNFNQANMFRVHVNDAILDSSSFQGTNMFGMEGDNASFRYCDLSNALMKDTEFINCDFTGSRALNIILVIGVFIDSKLDSSDFSFSQFIGAGLENATFINARLHEVTFQGAHLQGADFSGADLKGCNFFGAEFADTKFTDAINIPKEIEKLIIDDKITGISFEGGNKD